MWLHQKENVSAAAPESLGKFQRFALLDNPNTRLPKPRMPAQIGDPAQPKMIYLVRLPVLL